MSLAKAFAKDTPPNIHNFTGVPEAKRVEKIFDPERDITEEDWRGMVGELKELRISKDDDSILAVIGLVDGLASIFPNQKIELSDDDYKKGIDYVNELRNSSAEDKWPQISMVAAIYSNLFPERQQDFKLNDADFIAMTSFLNSCRSHDFGKSMIFFSAVASSLLVLFPDRISEIALSDEDFKAIIKQLEVFRNAENWPDFVFLTYFVTVLFPERREEIGLSDDDRVKMSEQVKEFRANNRWHDFVWVAKFLYTIFADEIKRKPDGTLDIIFNKPKQTELKEETPPLPTTRNY